MHRGPPAGVCGDVATLLRRGDGPAVASPDVAAVGASSARSVHTDWLAERRFGLDEGHRAPVRIEWKDVVLYGEIVVYAEAAGTVLPATSG